MKVEIRFGVVPENEAVLRFEAVEIGKTSPEAGIQETTNALESRLPSSPAVFVPLATA